jgi:hypothetical protein
VKHVVGVSETMEHPQLVSTISTLPYIKYAKEK